MHDFQKADNVVKFETKHSPAHPRFSEGSFIELHDGRILVIYTRYDGNDWHDHCAANLVSRTSSDGGMTWSGEKIEVQNDSKNIMSVSLLRLQDGRIALVYLRKSAIPGSKCVDCRPWIRFSSDESETWSEGTAMTDVPPVYLVGNNDRLIQLKSGRLVFPVAYHYFHQNHEYGIAPSFVKFLISDDGISWHFSADSVFPYRWIRSGLQEPGVIELKDGRLLAWARTDAGCQYKMWSGDGGETWSEPVPAPEFTGPLAPLSMKRDPVTGYLAAIWNDYNPRRCVKWAAEDYESTHGLTPFVMAFSKDEGASWGDHVILEDDPKCGFAYAAMLFLKDRLLLHYNCGGCGGHGSFVHEDARITTIFR